MFHPAIGRGASMMSGRENDRHLRGDWPHFRSFAKQPIITRRANNNKTRNKNNIHGQLSALQKHGNWKGGSGNDSLKSCTRETIDSRIGINSVLVPFLKIFVIYMLNVKCTHLKKRWWNGGKGNVGNISTCFCCAAHPRNSIQFYFTTMHQLINGTSNYNPSKFIRNLLKIELPIRARLFVVL